MSAVEGIMLIPGYENTPRIVLLIIASAVAFALFAVQKKGIEKVASAFGPIMVVWFFAIGSVGGYFVLQNLEQLPSNPLLHHILHPVFFEPLNFCSFL